MVVLKQVNKYFRRVIKPRISDHRDSISAYKVSFVIPHISGVTLTNHSQSTRVTHHPPSSLRTVNLGKRSGRHRGLGGSKSLVWGGVEVGFSDSKDALNGARAESWL
jgi:hypothetical protein